MSWHGGAWGHPADNQWHQWGMQNHQASVGGFDTWHAPGLAEDGVKGWKLPADVAGGFASTRPLPRKNDAIKTYDHYTTLGGNVKNALPQSERVKLILFMIPDARQLRVTALTADELDAVIHIATVSSPACARSSIMAHRLQRHTPCSAALLCSMCAELACASMMSHRLQGPLQ